MLVLYRGEGLRVRNLGFCLAFHFRGSWDVQGRGLWLRGFNEGSGCWGAGFRDFGVLGVSGLTLPPKNHKINSMLHFSLGVYMNNK